MAELYRSDICNVDISKSLVRSYVGIVLATGDDHANRFGAVLNRAGKLVEIADVAVSVLGYFIRPDGETVVCNGAKDGNTVYVDLPAACYTKGGSFSLAIKVSSTEVTQTVRVIDGQIRLTQTETLIDPGEVIPSLEDLMAHIAEMEAATEAANEAADNADASVAGMTQKVDTSIATLTQEVNVAVAEMKEQVNLAAPSVVCDASGSVVAVTDAADRQTVQAVSEITAVQSGTGDPTPDNVRPINGKNTVSLWRSATYDTAAEATLTAALPETVYGGSLDWTIGVLTVTHRMLQLTGAASEKWMRNGNGHYYAQQLLADYRSTTGIDGYCTHYRYDIAYNREPKSMQGRGSNIWVMDADMTTVEDFKAYLAAQAAAGTPVTLVYPLEASYTIQLTPQQLDMFKGENHVWSDTGDTTLTYVADTKMYIDNKFSALHNAILAQGANI